MPRRIDKLIINKPYLEPTKHWRYVRETQEFEKRDGRREAGYWRAPPHTAASASDPGEFVPIDLVNKIRPRVRQWREAGYPRAAGVTKELLTRWHEQSKDDREHNRFFFCQLEAIETAIWLTEAANSAKQDIDIPSDGGDWRRICLKLATGTGKTVVMAMLIAWQALNKLADESDERFSSDILVVAPGLTVRDRLRVLSPSHPDNVYQEFNVVDATMWQELQRANLMITNWHALSPLAVAERSVVKKGAESDEAFCRRVIPNLDEARKILVINDEAHHCHRPGANGNKATDEAATVWVRALDRIHKARGVMNCYDLSATPFKPTGHGNQTEQLFSWIVSDFGLYDAIESGLVKTPRAAARDDSHTSPDLRSQFFHIYPQIKADLNRAVAPSTALPDLVLNALNTLGADWRDRKRKWANQAQPRKTPPVLIVICNRTHTAARVEHAITEGHVAISELGERDKLLRIDQEALDKLESGRGDKIAASNRDLVEEQRERFNTVGKEGKSGADVQVVIGVNMLSEGWDARTVTHILGLRAFTSQLLCEQVIGRGLRRISYDVGKDGLYEPEYVEVFGVPFVYLPTEEPAGAPPVEKPKTKIESLRERKRLAIDWPHVLQVNYKLDYYLDIDWDKLDVLTLPPADSPTLVEMAPVVEGQPVYEAMSALKTETLSDEERLQTLLLQRAVGLHKEFGENWPGDAGGHIGQAAHILERFIHSDKLQIKAPLRGDARNKIVVSNIGRIVAHVKRAIRISQSEEPIAVFDPIRPTRSTATAPTWYTVKPAQPVQKSQISHIVIDSGWESVGLEFERDRIEGIEAWAKNDHLGFEIYYQWQGETKRYLPDYIIRFKGARFLILEIKGRERDDDKAKWDAAREWVRAVNADGGFGKWEFKVLRDPADVFDVVR